MQNVLDGAKARERGGDFEQEIGKTFTAYAKVGKAYLDFMPLPMTPCGIRHPATRAPLYIPRGKTPFDVYGYAPHEPRTAPRDNAPPLAVFIGAELKSSKDPETTLPIVKPGSHAHGIAYHQLDALALLARIGGIARVVWNNAGMIGVLDEQRIIAAHAIYQRSLSSEQRGNGMGPKGSRSLSWEMFQRVEYANVGGTLCIDWLKLEGQEP
jgi:hypothetical protein